MKPHHLFRCNPAIAASTHNAQPHYRPDIDGLRALAIIAVVCFHAFPSILRGGFIGVDVFFVISGFLISSIIFRSLQQGDFSFPEFYAHRVRRIFPALIVVLAASFIFGWFILMSDEFERFNAHMAAGAGFVQNFVLQHEAGYFDVESDLKPLLHLWSLAIEEQFYIFFPLTVWVVWRAKGNLFTVIGVLAFISFAANVIETRKSAVDAFFFPHTRVWELLAGSMLAYLSLRPAEAKIWLIKIVFLQNVDTAHPRFREAASWTGLVFISFAAIHFKRGSHFPGWDALFPVLGAVLMIFAGSGAWLNKNLLSSRPMLFIGAISYPLYLWHWPLLSFARIVQGGAPPVSIRLSLIALSFVLAVLTYRFIERPIRFNKNAGRAKVISLSLLLFVLLILGLVGQSGAFEKWRNPALVANASNFSRMTDRFGANGFCRKRYPGFIGKFCSLAEDREPTIALVGDSHAAALDYGLARQMESRGENLLNIGEPSCLPFFDATFLSNGKPYVSPDDCRAKLNDAFSIVENGPSIKTVILASRGLEIKLTEDRQEEYKEAMRRSIKRLLDAHKKVIVVVDVPEPGFDPRTCVRPISKILSPTVSCEISKSHYEAYAALYRHLMAEVLLEFPSVKSFDTAEYLCGSETCDLFVNGKSFYRDTDHLSFDGSVYVGARLVRLID